LGLAYVVLAAVVVTRVDHDAALQTRSLQGVQRHRDALGSVVRAVLATAQDDVAVLVAGGCPDRGPSVRVHTEEQVAAAPDVARVDRDLHAAVGRVLETDGHRQARRELAVYLALRRPCADRAPRHRVRDVLRADRIQELTPHGYAQVEDVE